MAKNAQCHGLFRKKDWPIFCGLTGFTLNECREAFDDRDNAVAVVDNLGRSEHLEAAAKAGMVFTVWFDASDDEGYCVYVCTGNGVLLRADTTYDRSLLVPFCDGYVFPDNVRAVADAITANDERFDQPEEL